MNLFRKIHTGINTARSLKNVSKKGNGIKCNFKCRFTAKTEIGNDCHFNGMRISGDGRVVIGDHFHSGKKIRIITSFHNYEGNALPYDNTYISKDVIIEDNVWLGEDIIILGGVTIGEGAVIQAGSVVCKDIPKLAVAGGHPATPFKYRDSEHYYNLKNSRDRNS